MIKRVAKIVGVVGGIAALIWAVRDRFISLTPTHDPQPPAFRGRQAPTPVNAIEGIGPVFAERLNSAGISDVGRLAGASPDAVAEAARVSAARARAWIQEAQTRA